MMVFASDSSSSCEEGFGEEDEHSVKSFKVSRNLGGSSSLTKETVTFGGNGGFADIVTRRRLFFFSKTKEYVYSIKPLSMVISWLVTRSF